MKFFIPSYNRYDIIGDLTLKVLSFAEKEDIYLFINAEQVELYEKKVGDRATIVPVYKKGITQARLRMQTYARDNGIDHFFMFDDDLISLQRAVGKTERGFSKLADVPSEEVEKELKLMEEECIRHDKICVGLTPKRMGFLPQTSIFRNGQPYEFSWINNKWYVENDAYLPETLVRFEDTWMCMYPIQKTRDISKTQMYTRLIFNCKPTAYKGGCSDTVYHDAKLNLLAFKAFPNYLPYLRLTPVIRKTASGWINYNWRIDWKNTFKQKHEPVNKLIILDESKE